MLPRKYLQRFGGKGARFSGSSPRCQHYSFGIAVFPSATHCYMLKVSRRILDRVLR